MGEAADDHHPGTWRLLQPVDQVSGQREMPQMIGAELHLEAICGLVVGGCHHARVVDQDIQFLIGCQETFGKALNRTQVRQVELFDDQLTGRFLAANLPRRRFGFVQATARHDHGRPFLCQCQCGLVADPAVRAGHDHEFSALVRDIRCCPLLVVAHLDTPEILSFVVTT
jgi:hypothetical protein